MSIRDEIRALCAEHDKLMAEDAWMADRAARTVPPVQKSVGDGLVYRTHENNAPAPAPQPADAPSESEQTDWSRWEKWLRGHLDIEREEMLAGIAKAVMILIHRERDSFERKIAELRAENIELKGLLTDALNRFAKINDATRGLTDEIAALQAEKREAQIRNQAMIERSGRVADLQRENAASRAALERQRFERAFAERDHRIEQLETRLGMLLKFLGGDLPRGFWGRTDDAA